MENLVTLLREGNVRVTGKDSKILFEGTKEQLVQFITDSINMAECIDLDIQAGNIENEESSYLDFKTYEDFTKYCSINLGFPKGIKKSEELLTQANQEDNDLKYMGLFKKAQREKRWEVFQETVLPVLVERNISYHFSEEKYSYTFSSSEHGNVDFFVKANKVHIRVLNKWIEGNAIQWLFKHIINK